MLKVLFICKADLGAPDQLTSFNRELVEGLKKQGHQVDVHIMYGGGLSYIRFIKEVTRKIKNNNYDIAHASYALSGLSLCFQNKTPSIVSYLGSDINDKKIRMVTINIVLKRINAAIFVSEGLYKAAGEPAKGTIIPMGVNTDKFFPIDKHKARQRLGMSEDVKYILFSARFDRAVKNAPLAFDAIKKLNDSRVQLIELKNIPDEQMNSLFNACDVCLLTSFNEGSPQFIKEAMACNKPIVSTDVGDVNWIFGDTPGHFLSSHNASELADCITHAFDFLNKNGETKGRERLLELDIDVDSTTIRNIGIYNQVISANK